MRAALLLVAAGILAASLPAAAQTSLSTAITCQGRLSDAGAPAAGAHDFVFRLFDAASAGGQVGPTLCADDVMVADGLFMVSLDFGDQYTPGEARYLDVQVRAGAGVPCGTGGGFEALSPRQALTMTPSAGYAIQARTSLSAAQADEANNASALAGQTPAFYRNAANLNAGTIADARLSSNVPRLNAGATFTGVVSMTNAGNSFAGTGTGLVDLNASNLTQGTIPSAALFGTYPNALSLTNFNNVLAGDGLGIRTLNVSNATTGVLAPGRGGTGAIITGASVGQVLKWNGGAFTAQNENAYLAGNGLSLSSNTFSIGAGQITGSMIADGTITGASIAADTIGSGHIGSNAVTSSELALDAGSLARVTNGVMALTGVNVAIGGSTDSNRLRVVGTLGVTSSASVAGALSAASLTFDPVTHIYLIQPLDLRSFSSSDDTYVDAYDSGADANAAVHLPDGATITRVDLFYQLSENSVPESFEARLWRKRADGVAGSLLIAELSDESAVPTPPRQASAIVSHVVSNQFVYRFEWTVHGNGVIPEPRFFSCRIQYTIDRP